MRTAHVSHKSVQRNDPGYCCSDDGKVGSDDSHTIRSRKTRGRGGAILSDITMKYSRVSVPEKTDGNKVINQSYAPGFGNEDDGKWGFRYTISYFFHL